MTLAGAAAERVSAVPTGDGRVSAGWDAVLDGAGLRGLAWRRDPAGRPAVADGNRSVVLPGPVATVDGLPMYASLKGVGAVTPMYGDELPGRAFTGEVWYGEAPFGGQGPVNALRGLDVTARAAGTTSVLGLRICPVVQVVEVPEGLVDRGAYWYRRWAGPVLQELRLVPSDVRLFHAAPTTLGQDPEGALARFGDPDLDTFLENLLRSGLAALTVWARTTRDTPHGPSGLSFANVWLDKDSVVAPDGTLFFADLEGLDERPAGPGSGSTAEERVREAFEHNRYELWYAVDLLQRLHERRSGRPLDPARRRRVVAARVELAVAGDPVLRALAGPSGLDLEVRPGAGVPPVTLRLIDW